MFASLHWQLLQTLDPEAVSADLTRWVQQSKDRTERLLLAARRATACSQLTEQADKRVAALLLRRLADAVASCRADRALARRLVQAVRANHARLRTLCSSLPPPRGDFTDVAAWADQCVQTNEGLAAIHTRLGLCGLLHESLTKELDAYNAICSGFHVPEDCHGPDAED
jgi:hypothetical protein